MADERGAHLLPLLLLAGFRQVIDDLHRELARRGHPDARPLHGFALQAVGAEGASVAELGRRLGVSKQAAGKTADGLEQLGYLRSQPDPGDRRLRRLQITDSGADLLAVSAEVLGEVRADWADRLGAARLDALEADLDKAVGGRGAAVRWDLPGWLAAGTEGSALLD